MITPSIITRSKRNTLSLTVDYKGDLIVKAPTKMPIEEIFGFIQKKQKWIEERQSKIKSVLSKNFELINYQSCLFLGKKYKVVFAIGIEKPYLTEECIILKKCKSINSIKLQLKQFLVNSCDEILLKRVNQLSKITKSNFNSVKIISSKVKWGMCDSNKNLYFNFKLLLLPPEIIDYVIIHELCHLKQMNHSKNFWNLVAKYLPKYKEKLNQLKASNFLIKMFC